MSDPTYHPALNDMINNIPFLLAPETDSRAVAIVGAAYLEEYLKDALLIKLPGANSELQKKLFETYGPLGTMQARIDMAMALQIIGADFRKACITIARIRNRFAHRLDISTFDHPEIAELCESLSHPILKIAELPPRDRFTRILLVVMSGVSNHLNPNEIRDATSMAL